MPGPRSCEWSFAQPYDQQQLKFQCGCKKNLGLIPMLSFLIKSQ